MIGVLYPLFGGIGLFLLGMALLTDGLKAFAADKLQLILTRSTARPIRAFATGALVTALVQSSSATTVTMIGFVSAGLLTFPQAVGVLLGASLGTTSTGWIVSVLGLKVSIGYYALPMVGAGAFMKLLARGRWKSLGLAIAGFGLIFVGIETLQMAMGSLGETASLSRLPSGGLLTRALAVFVGVGLTVVLQSSSAAVALTLTALHTSSLTFEQAALLVIGASIGTTTTGALAAIGANVPAKRTALALVLLNSATGAIAIAMLPVFLWGIGWAQQNMSLEPGAASLAAFHTAFTALGVLVFLPRVDRLAHWVERIVPDKGPALTAHLDKSLLNVPWVALEATRRSLRETAAELAAALRDSLDDRTAWSLDESRRLRIQQALTRSREFFETIPPITEDQGVSKLRVSLLHAFDHLARLERYSYPPSNIRRVLGHDRMKESSERCRELLAEAATGLREDTPDGWLERVERMSRELRQSSRSKRPALLQETALGEWRPQEALDVLDGMRWFRRISNHTRRAGHYLSSAERPEQAADVE